MRGPRWLAEHEGALRELCRLGHCAKEIARKLGRTPKAVYCRAQELKIKFRQA